MFTGIVWNGLGALGLVLALKAFQRLRKSLRGQGTKKILVPVFIGVTSGIVGLILGTCIFESIDSYLNLYPIDYSKYSVGDNVQLVEDIMYGIRTALIFVFFVSCAYAVGILAEKVLQKEATADVALVASLLITIEPVIYGWFVPLFLS